MFRVVGLQVLVTLAVALFSWPLGGAQSALSALLGGAACVVPNALYAANLVLLRRGTARLVVAAVLVGEFVKVGLTVVALVLVATLYRDVVWVAVIVSVIAALKVQVLAWAWH